MYLFPSGLMLGGKYTWGDYLFWNELPTVVGNLVGGLTFVGATLYGTYRKTSPARSARSAPIAETVSWSADGRRDECLVG
jgi:hypothetical protein